MKALDYVRSKQEEHPPTENWRHLVDDLWGALGPRIPLLIQEMKDDGRLAIGMTSEEGPRIYVHYLPEENYAIVIHQDLPQLIYRVTRAALSQLNIGAGGIEYPAETDLKRVTQVIADILWWFQQTGDITGPDYSLTKLHIQFAGMLATETESFLLAHELGHVIVNPGDVIEPEQLIERLISGVFSGFVPPEASRWDEEFHADIVAFRLVLGIATRQVSQLGWQNQLRYGGAELMLLIEHALSELGFSVATTHPPAIERLRVLREYSRSISQNDEGHAKLTEIARMFERLLMGAIERLKDPATDAAFYQAESDAAVSDLNEYVDRFANQGPPDYFMFYEKLNELLGRGYYHVVLERIADYVKQLAPANQQEVLRLEAVDHMGEKLSESERSQLLNYRKYKLILGYFRQRDDAIGQYMRKVISLS